MSRVGLRRLLAGAALLAAAHALVACRRDEAPSPTPSLVITSEGDATRVVVTASVKGGASLPAGDAHGALSEPAGRALLALRLVEEDPHGQPVVGTYRRAADALVFTPAFRLAAGRRYRARLRLPGEPDVTAEHDVPVAPPAPRTEVVAVYPSGDVLPANHLKFYVEFSAPMQGGEETFRRLSLVEEGAARPEPAPFRGLELWSRDRRMLTVLLHPGRVKREISFAASSGPVLHAGRSYVLRVDDAMLDARGERLARPFEKRFRVIAADRERLAPERWTLDAPRVGTREPLSVRFDEPLDRLHATTGLTVRDAAGREVGGEAQVDDGERRFRLVPQVPWTPERHTLRVDEEVADLAGNTAALLFDRRVGEREAQPGGPREIEFWPLPAR